MARIRTVKPEFFTSEDIVKLSPRARLLYIAVWCECDKEGRLSWKPNTFKLRYFPGDDCDINELCSELTGGDLVRLYGNSLAYVPQFAKHQHINPRESDSSLPDPDASTTREPRVATRQPRDIDAQGGREGKGKEGKEKTPAPDGADFSPSAALAAHGVSETLIRDFLKIRNTKHAPLTQTALDGIEREAKKAGVSIADAVRICVERNWQGFNAGWLEEKKVNGHVPQGTFPNATTGQPAKATAADLGLE